MITVANGEVGWIAGLPDLPGLGGSGPSQIGGEDRIRRVHSCQQVRVRIQVWAPRRGRAWPHRRSQTRWTTLLLSRCNRQTLGFTT